MPSKFDEAAKKQVEAQEALMQQKGFDIDEKIGSFNDYLAKKALTKKTNPIEQEKHDAFVQAVKDRVKILEGIQAYHRDKVSVQAMTAVKKESAAAAPEKHQPAPKTKAELKAELEQLKVEYDEKVQQQHSRKESEMLSSNPRNNLWSAQAGNEAHEIYQRMEAIKAELNPQSYQSPTPRK